MNGNVYVSSKGGSNYDYEDDDSLEESSDDDEELRPNFDTGDLDEIFETDNGNLYVEDQLRVDGKGSFKAAEYQSGYNLPADDKSSKFASTEWVK